MGFQMKELLKIVEEEVLDVDLEEDDFDAEKAAKFEEELEEEVTEEVDPELKSIAKDKGSPHGRSFLKLRMILSVCTCVKLVRWIF